MREEYKKKPRFFATALTGVAVIFCQIFWAVPVARADRLISEQIVTDMCDGDFCMVDPISEYGESFNGSLSGNQFEYLTNVEVFVVNNNSQGFVLQVCDNTQCYDSGYLDGGVPIEHQWQGFDFSEDNIRLDSVATLKIYPENGNAVFLGGSIGDTSALGSPIDSRGFFGQPDSVGDLAFRVRGETRGVVHVRRSIVNDNSGIGTASDFPLHLVRSGDQVAMVPYAQNASGDDFAVLPGAYSASESKNIGGYATSVSGDCDGSGGVSVAEETEKTCLFSNDDIPIGFSFAEQEDALTRQLRLKGPQINLSGRAYPGAAITLAKKTLDQNVVLKQGFTASEKGDFAIAGIPAEFLSYSLLTKDRFGRAGPTKVFSRQSTVDSLNVSDIIIPPTVDFVRPVVTRGDTLKVVGSGYPGIVVQIRVNNDILYETKVSATGTYRLAISTARLDPGTYSVVARERDPIAKKNSDFSLTKNFTVSNLSVPRADLNGDNKIDITDASIFLERWRQNKLGNTEQAEAIDMNDDGKVTITDFSIFLRAFKKK